MDPRLQHLICDFQLRVAEAVELLEASGIPRPASNLAWTLRNLGRRGVLVGGFTYFKHGCGCSVEGPLWGVDFRFGERGEINGFDACRLKGFALDRLEAYGFHSTREIERAVEEARRRGELRQTGGLLYVSSRVVH
jgi:hypothetical protein